MKPCAEPRWQVSSFGQLNTLELYRILQLRQNVFVLEQTCLYTDLDDLDMEAVHLMCWRDDHLLAYARCLPPGLSHPESAMGRIAVSPTNRGSQLGRTLVQRGIDFNTAEWPRRGIRISAQTHLLDFYISLGFVAASEEYVEDGIPHIEMLYHRQ